MGIGKSSNKAPPSRITEHDKAILQLKLMRDKLKQYKARIEIKLENEKQVARQLLKDGQIEKAKLLLKKKKFYENNIHNTDQQLDNLDQLVTSLEFKQIESQVFSSMKVGNECLKKLNEMMSLDEIEDLMDDTREAIEHQQRINELLGTQITEQDMDNINRELDEIIKSTLPEVPSDQIGDALGQKELPTTAGRVPTKAKAQKSDRVAVMAE